MTLRNDGDIWFAYQKIPIEIISIKVQNMCKKVTEGKVSKTFYGIRQLLIVESFHLHDLTMFSPQDDDHPVKVGLSDAYIIDRTIYCD